MNFRYRVKGWLKQQAGFPIIQHSLDYLISVTFSRFYIALHKRDADDFPNVAAFLGYLRTCAISTIVDELRLIDKDRNLISIDEEILNSAVIVDGSQIMAAHDGPDQNDIWKRIITLFPDSRKQQLIRLRFVEGLRPAEIAALFPEKWAEARQVSIELYYIRQKLRQDPILRRLMGIEDNTKTD